MIFSVNPACAKELIFNTAWIDNSGEHKLVMAKEVNKGNTGEHLSVKQVTKGKDDWILNDYVNDCEVDINLNVIKNQLK